MSKKTKEQIQTIIDNDIAPALAMDGGGISLIDYKNGIVTVQLQGACHGCPGARMTLKMGVEARLKKAIPEIKEVVAV